MRVLGVVLILQNGQTDLSIEAAAVTCVGFTVVAASRVTQQLLHFTCTLVHRRQCYKWNVASWSHENCKKGISCCCEWAHIKGPRGLKQVIQVQLNHCASGHFCLSRILSLSFPPVSVQLFFYITALSEKLSLWRSGVVLVLGCR